MDPIVVFGDLSNGPLWVGDGHTRAGGAQDAGLTEIEVQCRPGGRREALLYSITDANGKHGAPLTLSDRRKAAQILIDDPEWSQMSDREISRRTGLSHPTVAALRPAPADGDAETRKGADGRVRKLPQRTPPKARADGLPSANVDDLPPSTNLVDRWQRFLQQQLSDAEIDERMRSLTDEQIEAEAAQAKRWRADRKAAQKAGRPLPPFPPMPGYWITAWPGGRGGIEEAAKRLMAAAAAMGAADLRKGKLLGEVIKALRGAGHLIPSGKDLEVYDAYRAARIAALEAEPPPAAPPPATPAVDPRQVGLFDRAAADEPPAAPYRPLFEDGEEEAIAAAPEPERSEDDEDDDEPEADEDEEPIHVRDLVRAEAVEAAVDEERERQQQHRDRLVQERDEARRQRDQAQRELANAREQLAAAELRITEAGQRLHDQRRDGAALLKRAEAAEAERDQLREDAVYLVEERSWLRAAMGRLRAYLSWDAVTKAAGGTAPEVGSKVEAEALMTVALRLLMAKSDRDTLADQLRALREDAGACGLVLCEHDEGEEEGACGRLALPNPDGPALCARHQTPTRPRKRDDAATLRRAVASVAPAVQQVLAQDAARAAAPWEPASCGGAKAVHALPVGAKSDDDEGHPVALCGQRPSYRSKGWLTRVGESVTCPHCERKITAAQAAT